MLEIIVKYCITEAYSEPCRKSKTEHFAKIVNGLLFLQNAPS